MTNYFPTPLSFVRLQQMISPTLPIGAFTYSQGMEWAVEVGWIATQDDVKHWLSAAMQDSLCSLELPILIRLYRACEQQNEQAFTHYTALLLAARETSELRLEEEQRARALVRVLKRMPGVHDWPLLTRLQASLNKTQVGGFSMACYYWEIPVETALSGYQWAWLENMVSVAIKLIPLGQSDGQCLLYELSEMIESNNEQAMAVADNDIGASTTAIAIASSQHETQYCRLYRS